jgi:hypothetical protein
MVSIFFCSFVAVYDCKFYNHLVIVTYFTGLFMSLTEASNHKQKSLEQHVKFLPWKYLLLFYTCTSQLDALVYQKKIAWSGWR